MRIANNYNGDINDPVCIKTEITNNEGTALVGQAAMAASIPVTLASDQSTITTDISDKPARDLGKVDIAGIDAVGGIAGQAAMAASIPVVLASDQSVVSVAGSYLVIDAIIAQSGVESTEIDLRPWKYISLLMPAGWNAATLTIKGSAVTGGTKVVIKNDAGQTFPAMTVAINEIYSIDANALMLAGVHFISLVASAAQTTAARTIKVMCKA